MKATKWNHKDLLGIWESTADEIRHLLDTASAFKEVGERAVKKVQSLRGQTMVSLLIEPSTALPRA